jgi:hypothetical protein
MPIHVTFAPKDQNFARSAPMLTKARASEAVADGNTGSLAAANGEFAIVVNTGAAVVYVAHGSTPSSAATAATSATSARYCIPSGGFLPVQVETGDKFAAAGS